MDLVQSLNHNFGHNLSQMRAMKGTRKFCIVGEEGTPCVTSDGKFGVMHAKDKDNRGPWIISGVHPDQVSSIDIICRIRPLRWAHDP